MKDKTFRLALFSALLAAILLACDSQKEMEKAEDHETVSNIPFGGNDAKPDSSLGKKDSVLVPPIPPDTVNPK